ncbi:carboxylesterase family protein [Beauveria brongniartii RCEF 3172]|uniref:Carboxylesterase family protein n=1 Tax=Beauveria brongniartii RCEF 3172 TaxID=1081107 RepID=A0A162JM20_9HYPO|nr:carboxylesterase family protein [Beauveria brongniartii RCEF 3172]
MPPARPDSIRPCHTHKTAFGILQDTDTTVHLYPPADKEPNSFSHALSELTIPNSQNIPLVRSGLDSKLVKPQIEQHVPRLQRPALSAHTFEPLAALDENSDTTFAQQKAQAANNTTRHTPTHAAPEPTLREQVQKHLAATPITGNQSNPAMSWDQQNAPPPYRSPALKVPEVMDMVENALSPALSGISDPSESLAGSSRTGSFSVPRIEDSLEELDRLEEQLEAVGALAKIKTAAPSDVVRSPAVTSARGSPSVQSITKRTSIMSLNSKTSEKSLRRSASMTLRQKNRQPATPPTRNAGSPASSTPTRSPKYKSTKPPTVPKFELPGEAVARRLKQQREARQALLEKSQKVNAAPAKPRTVTKPSFELPGEAISRRKREQHEAKLRAEEEEMRRKREFKARPFRNSSAPGVVPRETIASRARQAKLQEEEAKAKAAATVRGKRLSVVPGQVSAVPGTVRKTSAPTPGQRPASSLDAAQRTARRQSTLGQISAPRLRPNTAQDTGVKTAREQAAERSRAASREWAEKKRRQELAQKEMQRRDAAS